MLIKRSTGTLSAHKNGDKVLPKRGHIIGVENNRDEWLRSGHITNYNQVTERPGLRGGKIAKGVRKTIKNEGNRKR